MRRSYSLLAAATLALGLCFGAACGAKVTATQVIVELRADSAVVSKADTLFVEIKNGEGAVVLQHEKPITPDLRLLARIPLIPKGDDPTRRFTLTATLRKGETDVARVEARAGYVEHELRELELWFDAECVDKLDCEAGRTCAKGRCRGSCYEPRPSEQSGPSLPTCSECQTCVTSCQADDAASCGCPGDSCSNGACTVKNKVLHVAAGEKHTCAATRAEAVYCWGATKTQGAAGVLGTGPSGTSSATPIRIPDLRANRAVAAGNFHTCVQEQGLRTCWGSNQKGQLGGPPKQPMVPTPFAVVGETWDFLNVVAGIEHSCGLAANRQVLCWGGNAFGDLGTGDTQDTVVPTPVVANGQNSAYIALAGAGDHNCAIDDQHSLWCWGRNSSYELGTANSGPAYRPYPIRPGCEAENSQKNCFSDWVDVATGSFHTCAIRADGQLYCWGGNLRGQVGNGVTGPPPGVSEPTQVGVGVKWQRVFCGRSHTCAVDTENKLHCWGDDGAGQGARSDAAWEPTLIEFAGDDGATGTDVKWLKASLGEAHSCGVRLDESLWCWGENADGQLGIGVMGGNYNHPTRVCLPDQ